MTKCAGCPREAEYEVHTGKRWQPHCKPCADEAMECEQGALIRRIGQYGLLEKGKG